MPSIPHGRQTRASVSARGTIQLLLARGCFLVGGYTISVLLARGLGPAEFGVYGIIMSILVWVEIVGSAGVPGATAQLIPRHYERAADVERSAQFLLVLWSFVLFAVCWTLAPTVAQVFNLSHQAALFRLAILDLPFSALYLSYQGVLNGHRRFGILSAGMIAYSATKVAGIVLLYILGLSVAGALVVNVLATVGALAYLVSRVRPTIPKPTRALTRTMVRIALPLGLFLITSHVSVNLDLWALQTLWTGPPDTIGIYIAAINLARVMNVVPIALSGVLFASLSWAIANNKEASARQYVRSASRFACMVLFPTSVVLATHAEPVLDFLYAGVYASGGILLTLQVFAFVCSAFVSLYLNALMASGKYYHGVVLLSAFLSVAFVSNLLLIPIYGALGAAIALLGVQVLGAIVVAVLTYRRFGTLIKGASLLRITVATALVGWLSTAIPLTGPALVPEFAALMLLYLLLLALLRELKWSDLRAFALWEETAP